MSFFVINHHKSIKEELFLKYKTTRYFHHLFFNSLTFKFKKRFQPARSNDIQIKILLHFFKGFFLFFFF